MRRIAALAGLLVACGGSRPPPVVAPDCAAAEPARCDGVASCRADLETARDRVGVRIALVNALESEPTPDLDALDRDTRALIDDRAQPALCPADAERRSEETAELLGRVARRFHAAAQSTELARGDSAIALYDASLALRPSGDEAAELAFYAAQLLAFRLARPIDAVPRYLAAMRASPSGPHAADAGLEALGFLDLQARVCSAARDCRAIEPLASETITLWLTISVGAEARVPGLLRAFLLSLDLEQAGLAARLARLIRTEAPGSDEDRTAQELLSSRE
jgi:hypothetical protein